MINQNIVRTIHKTPSGKYFVTFLGKTFSPAIVDAVWWEKDQVLITPTKNINAIEVRRGAVNPTFFETWFST